MKRFSLPEIKGLLVKTELIGQPIFAVKKGKLASQPNEYELLLRSQKTHHFPQQSFDSLVATHAGNELFWDWFAEKLVQIVVRRPQLIFSVNIEPQQLLFKSTWKFINSIKKYRSCIHLELTERVPNDDLQPEIKDLTLQQALAAIKQSGFFVALDDVACGQNSLQAILDQADSLKRIKFSLLDFKPIKSSLQLKLMELLCQLAIEFNLELVFEGAPFQQVAAVLADMPKQARDFVFWQAASEIRL
jgi:EAL domain-containing protein (putative c-di-GMP-specific phosphodiesterase class I)